MDSYMAAKAKGSVSNAECMQRSLTPEGFSQKMKNEYRQNNAHLNQMSFIPVYAKKTVCHTFSKTGSECENKCPQEEPHPQMNILSTNSSSSQKCITDPSERISSRNKKSHMRRRSVGFEDMTSLASCYENNFTNERRNQTTAALNSNISSSPLTVHSNINSEKDFQVSPSENRVCALNWNTQHASSENENHHICERSERSSQRYKDKSSKRKSSLNRIDFIQLPAPNIENVCYQDSLQPKNSSSDEGMEFRLQHQTSEFLCSTSKRKHNTSNTSHEAPNGLERKLNEATPHINSIACKGRANLLPRGLHSNHPKLRHQRLRQQSTTHALQKLSHSAGELESLTDFSEIHGENKISLSAQECDTRDYNALISPVKMHKIKNGKQKLFPQEDTNRVSFLLKNKCVKNASQKKDEVLLENSKCNISGNVTASDEEENVGNFFSKSSSNKDSKNNAQFSVKNENISHDTFTENAEVMMQDKAEFSVTENSNAAHVSSNSIDLDINNSATKLENLEISSEREAVEIYMSADENEPLSSDSEKKPSSILRKKGSEERKELHSILKPPADDKFSKTPQSILKHRESSEEKDNWQQTDLHSILKKSTSEDESCNSGPDIRPILKVSTDEDSPSGSVKPRPILKKRTSFSDECSYASFSSGELKPILKKKTPLVSEEQLRPILKSRRKSEDTRSLSEFITSRPRAYSADMGVKTNHEAQAGGFESRKEDFYKHDYHDL